MPGLVCGVAVAVTVEDFGSCVKGGADGRAKLSGLCSTLRSKASSTVVGTALHTKGTGAVEHQGLTTTASESGSRGTGFSEPGAGVTSPASALRRSSSSTRRLAICGQYKITNRSLHTYL